MRSLLALWARIHEPRAVSIGYFAIYLAGFGAGLYATFVPPSSIQGEVGAGAMSALTVLLMTGCAIGAVAALPGIYWLERTAVLSIALAMLLYLAVVLVLQVQEPQGNRLLQAWVVFAVLLMQVPVRWVRIRARPYRPDERFVVEA